eukprot:gene46545-62256_t
MSPSKAQSRSARSSAAPVESSEPLMDLRSRGITEVREIQNQVCGLQRFTFTTAVVVGIKTEGWVSSRQKMKFQALALNLAGKPQEGVSLDVKATA